LAPPLNPPNELDSTQSKQDKNINVKPYLNLLPHPKDHVKINEEKSDKIVDNLVKPFIALLPNPITNLISNQIIPPFLAK